MSKRTQQAEALFHQGQRLHMAGRLADAENVYRQALLLAPRHADVLHALGALALQSGRADSAETLVSEAIRVKPAAMFQLTRAHALLALDRPAEAEAACRAVLRGRPGSAESWQVLGHALLDGGQAEAAIEAYGQGLRLDPALPDLRNNLGTALRKANRLTEAETALLAAPPEREALVNLSSVQKELGGFDRAEATLRRALAIAPNDPVLHYNHALLMLLLGRFAEGWPGWEQRFRAGAIPAASFSQPQWQGDPLGDRPLLVHPEQGLGDIIQFCRYLPLIQGRVTFDAPARLARLLASNAAMPLAKVERFDVVAPLLSLPARMGGMGAEPPYLFAEPRLVADWRTRIGGAGFRIGVAWQGFSGRHEDKGRSIPLAEYQPLALPGVRLISLQKGQGEEQIPQAGFAVEVLPALDDGADAFIDTAAVMQTLDLVITSDTSIAHLAGALGRPVWVALRRVPDWRWLLDRTDSPWYPTMRLFRQERAGDWTTVFRAMAEALSRQLAR